MNYHVRPAIGTNAKVFPLSPSYCINEFGQVFRKNSNQALRPVLNQVGGYLQVSLWEKGKGKTWFVHQIVTITFHGQRPSLRHHAAHRNGVKTNNTKDNLRWLTKEENEAEKVLHGTSNHGQRNGMSRTSKERRAAA